MAQVTAPDGSTWTVRRRWYPWRRALSLWALWHGIPDDKQSDTTTTSSDDAKSTGNPIVHGILVVLAAVIWLVIQAGKAVLIVLAVLIAVTLSVVDPVLRLLVMPFVLLARAFGVMRWPVQIEGRRSTSAPSTPTASMPPHCVTVWWHGFSPARSRPNLRSASRTRRHRRSAGLSLMS